MPRSNRRRRDGRPVSAARPEARDIEQSLSGMRRVVDGPRGSHHVQPVRPGRSEKSYRCPGCGGLIAAGAAHLVVWRADGVLGDRADLEARRHWHEACWRRP